MTAVTLAPAGTGLGWVTFSDEEHGQTCQWREPECSAEAAYLVIAEAVRSPCKGHEHPICLHHKDVTLQMLAARTLGMNCSHRCGEGARSRVRRIEPLRGGVS